MRGEATGQIGLLLFTLGGVRFGVDAEQVLATAPYHGERGEEIPFLHERIGFGAASPRYLVPTVIAFGARQGGRRRVVIDGIEEIAWFHLDDLRPFPAVIEPLALRRGMWGVAPRPRGVILLLDLLILFGPEGLPEAKLPIRRDA